jgi:hypothetical protein
LLAHHFRCPLPRWVDEGMAVMAEDKQERNRHAHLARRIRQQESHFIPLRRLIALREYPTDVTALFAEGHSVCRFLLKSQGRQTLLAFIQSGMELGWDRAAHDHYGFKSVEGLERAWLDWEQKLRLPDSAKTTDSRR